MQASIIALEGTAQGTPELHAAHQLLRCGTHFFLRMGNGVSGLLAAGDLLRQIEALKGIAKRASFLRVICCAGLRLSRASPSEPQTRLHSGASLACEYPPDFASTEVYCDFVLESSIWSLTAGKVSFLHMQKRAE
eukprot:10209-Pelagomonas_calceolata.AAC.6